MSNTMHDRTLICGCHGQVCTGEECDACPLHLPLCLRSGVLPSQPLPPSTTTRKSILCNAFLHTHLDILQQLELAQVRYLILSLCCTLDLPWVYPSQRRARQADRSALGDVAAGPRSGHKLKCGGEPFSENYIYTIPCASAPVSSFSRYSTSTSSFSP